MNHRASRGEHCPRTSWARKGMDSKHNSWGGVPLGEVPMPLWPSRCHWRRGPLVFNQDWYLLCKRYRVRSNMLCCTMSPDSARRWWSPSLALKQHLSSGRKKKQKTKHTEEIKRVQIALISPLFIITFPAIIANGNNNNHCSRITLWLLSQILLLFTRQWSHRISKISQRPGFAGGPHQDRFWQLPMEAEKTEEEWRRALVSRTGEW